ncbi:hypothetical protein INR75_15290 [Zunongwangia sp. SCSIO 43204]|uniref:hypothetical protein n=1 Tax=Zunongwangia sp. SCSIO 43204 TaxID=2779359 RepID=UPI001CA8F927|nr:hypothetical protein [Zunongwangia sp. SCSIO 43204]UAB83525.1 hypothetical protein INR75_15290 [Zunongwangia sp. SCSIO 43204]
MENSIENIWKNGNHGNVKNIEFYNRESKLWFQQILKYLKKDNMSLIPVGLLILGVLLLYQEFLAAGLAFGFLFFLFLLNKNTIAKLKNIKPSDDVQHYVKTNQVFIKNQKRNYIILTGSIIPLFMLVELWLVFNDSEVYLNTIASISFIKKIIFAVFMYLAIGGISLVSYLVSTEAIYGKLLKKLDEIVSDFETENK